MVSGERLKTVLLSTSYEELDEDEEVKMVLTNNQHLNTPKAVMKTKKTILKNKLMMKLKLPP